MCDSKVNQGEMQEPHHSLIVRVVSSVLDKLISGHVDSPKRTLGCGNEFMKFQSSYAPDVTIESYLERIRRYSRCSDACFVMALIYVDRLIESKNLVLTPLNAHRLLITSVMLAAKFHDDLFYNNAYYSKLGGLSLNELNHLEAELLNLLDFSLFVKEVAYCKYSKQLQNYVFYLEVITSPRSSTGPTHASCETQPVHLAPSQMRATHVQNSVMTPVLLQQSLQQAALSFEYAQEQQPFGDRAALRVPSPDNPHAKAGSFSENYLAANSPLRIAPASVSNARQALLQAQAQVLANNHHQAQLLAQRYSQNYFARDPAAMQPPRARSPLDYASFEACLNSAECPVTCTGGYFNHYTPASMTGIVSSSYSARDSMRDSIDETSTTCSTRTASPYPALYSRSNSSSNVLAGTHGLTGASSASGTALTPSMYPAQGMLPNLHHLHTLPAQVPAVWSADSSFSHNHSPMAMQGQSRTPRTHESQNQSQSQQASVYQARTDLSIQTDLLMEAYPLQRGDSGLSSVGSVATPYSVYHGQHQMQSQSQGHFNHHSQKQSQFRQLSPLGKGSGGGGYGSGNAAHTPNHHYATAQLLTPTERRYQQSQLRNYSFAPAPEVYGYRSGSGECETSVNTPRDYYHSEYGGNNGHAGGGRGASAYATHPSFPCPAAMLYASNASMHSANAHNVNLNMHGAMSDPMNFYGYSAGVNAGQM